MQSRSSFAAERPVWPAAPAANSGCRKRWKRPSEALPQLAEWRLEFLDASAAALPVIRWVPAAGLPAGLPARLPAGLPADR